MSVAKLTARILRSLTDLQNRVSRLERAVFPKEEPKGMPEHTLYDHQTRIEDFVSEEK